MHESPKPLHRYLVSFQPKVHPHYFTDVLIVGGGLAGLRAALAVDPSLDVLIVSKSPATQSNSANAQGGIASVWASTDTFESHINDTLESGGDLCDRNIVEHVVRKGPDEIRKLIEIGTHFDHTDEILDLGREGGHAHNRILHALGDGTGKEIIRAVVEEVQRRPNIRLWDTTFALDLLTAQGKCRGAVCYWETEKKKELIWAKQTIIAAGGIGQVYRETTNPEIATGDGIAMAYRAGALVQDMEFIQFHPTVLYIAGGSRSLITEAMRGAGAFLVDKNGYRFMSDYDPRGELAPRDVVSRAIVHQMNKTNFSNVFLDLTYRDPKWIYARFPGIAAQCEKFGIDIATERIPVRPGTHYIMGGIAVDPDGRTSIPGLWAAGECASTGLHGANRLASNSLLEALVFGESCGRLAGQAALDSVANFQIQANLDHMELMPDKTKTTQEEQDEIDIVVNLSDIRNSLKSTMWRSAGVIRDAEGLEEAEESCRRFAHYVLAREFTSAEGWELQNMILIAQLILSGAKLREETRGAHNREDFPMSDPQLAHKHFDFCFTDVR